MEEYLHSNGTEFNSFFHIIKYSSSNCYSNSTNVEFEQFNETALLTTRYQQTL